MGRDVIPSATIEVCKLGGMQPDSTERLLLVLVKYIFNMLNDFVSFRRVVTDSILDEFHEIID